MHTQMYNLLDSTELEYWDSLFCLENEYRHKFDSK